MRIALIALVSLSYDGRLVAKDAAFSATEEDARILKLLKRAKDAAPVSIQPIEPSQSFKSSDLTEAEAPETIKPKRVYRRRDMTAEDAEL